MDIRLKCSLFFFGICALIIFMASGCTQQAYPPPTYARPAPTYQRPQMTTHQRIVPDHQGRLWIITQTPYGSVGVPLLRPGFRPRLAPATPPHQAQTAPTATSTPVSPLKAVPVMQSQSEGTLFGSATEFEVECSRPGSRHRMVVILNQLPAPSGASLDDRVIIDRSSRKLVVVPYRTNIYTCVAEKELGTHHRLQHAVHQPTTEGWKSRSNTFRQEPVFLAATVAAPNFLYLMR